LIIDDGHACDLLSAVVPLIGVTFKYTANMHVSSNKARTVSQRLCIWPVLEK